METAWEPNLSGPINMDRDRALWERAESGEPGLRLYTWDGPWVSLGRFQKPERALLHPESTPWVMRPTGGKGVLHGHDLTIGWAVPLESLGLAEDDSRRIKPIYRRLIAPLIEALNAVGAPSCLGEEITGTTTGGTTPDCFAHVAPNDVVDSRTGAKRMGVALAVGRRAVLAQCSLPIRPPLVPPESVYPDAAAPVWTDGLEAEPFLTALAESDLIRRL